MQRPREFGFTEAMEKQENRGLLFFETTGFSMWPFLKGGSKLIVKRVPKETLRVGDIVLYRLHHNTVCHRLVKKVKIKGDYLLYTRGDNSTSSPELITEEMFLSKAIGIITDGKIISVNGMRQQLINRVIVLVAPLVSVGFKMLKPLAHRLYKNHS